MVVLDHWNIPMNLEVKFTRSGFEEKPGYVIRIHMGRASIYYSGGSEVIKGDSLEKFLLFIPRTTTVIKHIFCRLAILHLFFQRKTSATFGTSEYHELKYATQLERYIPIC